MIDAGIAGLERALETDVQRHVPGEADAGALRRRTQAVEHLPLDSRVDLEKVVPSGLLLGHHAEGGLYRRHAVAVERGPGRVDRGADEIGAGCTGAKLEMARVPQHPADGSNSSRDVEKESALDHAVRGLAPRNVRVHLRQSRNQELAGPVDPDRAGGQWGVFRRTDRQDPVSLDHHSSVRNRSLPVHRNDREGAAHSSRVRQMPWSMRDQVRAAAARLERSNSFMNFTRCSTAWRGQAL